MPQVIKILGAYQLPESVNELDNSERFNFIYKSGLWFGGSGNESRSGSGSTKKNTELYISQLSQYLDLFAKLHKGKDIKFFDAPCGDLNWVKEIFEKVKYSGGDISESLISDLNEQFPNINTYRFDIIVDEFPDADIWHCRHCLFHLSLSDIAKSLEAFCKSKIDIALITNHFLPDSLTFDIDTGSFRFLDLTNFPFHLPEPQLWLLDSDPLSGKIAMATGVWSRSQIEVGLSNYHRLMEA
jgi:hypothetical protein